MNSEEKEVLEIHEIFWQSLAKRDLETRISLCADEITFFGTGHHEHADGKEQIMKISEASFKQYPKPFEIIMDWVKVRIIGQVACVECETIWVREGKEKPIEEEIRLTTIFKKVENEWLVIHVHGSEPDYRLLEGQYSFDEDTLKRNMELEKLVYLRTKELTRANEALIENGKVIAEMLVEKDLLMKEIHHRVKNNLQVISGLLELQWVRTTDENIKAALSDSQNRILSMAFIHHNLYRNDNLKGVEMRSFADDLTNHIKFVFETKTCPVIIENNFENLFLDIDTAIPLGLLINELLTNSFKYAFEGKENGLIRLEFKKVGEGNYFFSYFDDGKGLPEEINLKKVSTLGLKLVSLLSNQVGGEINYQYADGSFYQLEFKDHETRDNMK